MLGSIRKLHNYIIGEGPQVSLPEYYKYKQSEYNLLFKWIALCIEPNNSLLQPEQKFRYIFFLHLLMQPPTTPDQLVISLSQQEYLLQLLVNYALHNKNIPFPQKGNSLFASWPNEMSKNTAIANNLIGVALEMLKYWSARGPKSVFKEIFDKLQSEFNNEYPDLEVFCGGADYIERADYSWTQLLNSYQGQALGIAFQSETKEQNNSHKNNSNIHGFPDAQYATLKRELDECVKSLAHQGIFSVTMKIEEVLAYLDVLIDTQKKTSSIIRFFKDYPPLLMDEKHFDHYQKCFYQTKLLNKALKSIVDDQKGISSEAHIQQIPVTLKVIQGKSDTTTNQLSKPLQQKKEAHKIKDIIIGDVEEVKSTQINDGNNLQQKPSADDLEGTYENLMLLKSMSDGWDIYKGNYKLDKKQYLISVISKPRENSHLIEKYNQETRLRQLLTHPNVMPIVKSGRPPYSRSYWFSENYFPNIDEYFLLNRQQFSIATCLYQLMGLFIEIRDKFGLVFVNLTSEDLYFDRENQVFLVKNWYKATNYTEMSCEFQLLENLGITFMKTFKLWDNSDSKQSLLSKLNEYLQNLEQESKDNARLIGDINLLQACIDSKLKEIDFAGFYGFASDILGFSVPNYRSLDSKLRMLVFNRKTGDIITFGSHGQIYSRNFNKGKPH